MHAHTQRGASLIEVLVSLLLVSVGFLAATAVQWQLVASAEDSRQHADALSLLEPITQAMQANRQQAAAYLTDLQGIGVGTGCPVAGYSAVSRELAAWCTQLQQTAQGLWGARGCVEALSAGRYRITVAWRGFTASASPPASIGCAAHFYDDSACPDDRCRRVQVVLLQGGGG